MPGCSHRGVEVEYPYRRAVRRHSYIRQRQTSNSVLCLWEASLVLFARFRGTSNLVFLDKKDIEDMREIEERGKKNTHLLYHHCSLTLRFCFYLAVVVNDLCCGPRDALPLLVRGAMEWSAA